MCASVEKKRERERERERSQEIVVQTKESFLVNMLPSECVDSPYQWLANTFRGSDYLGLGVLANETEIRWLCRPLLGHVVSSLNGVMLDWLG